MKQTDINRGPFQTASRAVACNNTAQPKSNSTGLPHQVKTGILMKRGTPVKDDPGITASSKEVVQGVFEVEADNLKGFIEEQARKQSGGRTAVDLTNEPVVTVGFEAEFAQSTPDENPLAGISHLVLAEEGTPKMKYTGLGFVLETDANNAIELVTPPFVIRSRKDHPVPLPGDIESIDKMLRGSLTEIANSAGTIGGLEEKFKSDAGITFAIGDTTVEQKNLSHNSIGKYGRYKEYGPEPSSEKMAAYISGKGPEPKRTSVDKEAKTIPGGTLKSIGVRLSQKGGGISTQVNFATNLQTFNAMSTIGRENMEKDKSSSMLNEIKGIFAGMDKDILPRLQNYYTFAVLKEQLGMTEELARNAFGLEVTVLKDFLPVLSRNLAGQVAIPFISALDAMQKELYQNKAGQKDFFGQKDNKQLFIVSAYLSSIVKDLDETWLKDTVLSVAQAVIPAENRSWAVLYEITQMAKSKDLASALSLPALETTGDPFTQSLKLALNKQLKSKWPEIKNAINTSLYYLERAAVNMKKGRLIPEPGPGSGKGEGAGFLEHHDAWITPRQDTMISPDKAQIAYWQKMGVPLHVVESRRDSVSMIKAINDFLEGSKK